MKMITDTARFYNVKPIKNNGVQQIHSYLDEGSYKNIDWNLRNDIRRTIYNVNHFSPFWGSVEAKIKKMILTQEIN